jgi:hypothetical protein
MPSRSSSRTAIALQQYMLRCSFPPQSEVGGHRQPRSPTRAILDAGDFGICRARPPLCLVRFTELWDRVGALHRLPATRAERGRGRGKGSQHVGKLARFNSPAIQEMPLRPVPRRPGYGHLLGFDVRPNSTAARARPSRHGNSCRIGTSPIPHESPNCRRTRTPRMPARHCDRPIRVGSPVS